MNQTRPRLRSSGIAFALALAPSLTACVAANGESAPANQEEDLERSGLVQAPHWDIGEKPGALPHFTGAEHARDFRAAWIASVFNINFPSSSTLSAAAQKAQLIGMLDKLKALNTNVVAFQVRPESDALYKSSIDPWSRFLTGTSGKDPGWDPLEFLVIEAHKRSMEVHAWVNPYRGAVNRTVPVAANHITKAFPQYTVTFGNQLWLDPGAPPVRQRIVNTIRDIVQRYDIDGVCFDDYFYPFPAAGSVWNDDRSWNEYLAAGGKLTRSNWRRDNVNTLVREVHEAIEAEKPYVRFGISPFGIYRPGQPAGVVGTDAYEVLAADAKKWAQEKWVDYLAPQIYWTTTSTGQPFVKLLDWWTDVTNSSGLYNFTGIDITKIGTTGWTIAEYRKQLNEIYGRRHRDSMGVMAYHLAPLINNTGGMGDLFKEFWSAPALTPPLSSTKVDAGEWVFPPKVHQHDGVIEARTWFGANLRGFALYDASGEVPKLSQVTFGQEATFTVPAGTYVVTAIDKRSVESNGVRVKVQ